MKTPFISIIFIFLTSTFSSALTLQAGVWNTHSEFRVNGIPLPQKDKQECYDSEETRDVKSTLEKSLAKNGCAFTEWSLNGQNLVAALKCKNKDLNAKGKIYGVVTEKTYELKGEAKGTLKNLIPSTATLKLTGHWVEDCQ